MDWSAIGSDRRPSWYAPATRRLQYKFAELIEPALAGRHGLKALLITAENISADGCRE